MKPASRNINITVPVLAALLLIGWAPSADAINPKDLDRDGHSDLIFQNGAGQVYTWLMDGTGSAVSFSTGSGLKPGSKFIYSGALGDWKLKGRGDLNGDGIPDLIFQNSVGQVAVWFLDGTGNTVNFSTGSGLKPGSKLLYAGGLGDWSIKAVGDVNGDGKDDLVFQNGMGQIYVWFLDGSGNDVNFATGRGLKPGSKFIYGAGLGDWKIAGMGDLNGDGINDFVFRNSSGQVFAWFLDGTGNAVHWGTGSGLKPGSKFIYSGGLGDWKVKEVADLNDDGIADLVFQNGAGQIYAWFLDGSGDDVNFASGKGLKPGSKFIYGGGLGDWRVNSDDPIHDVADNRGGGGEVELSSRLTPSAAAPSGGAGKVQLSVAGSSVELEIEVEDIPAGGYAVSVGGIVRGVINIAAVSNGTKGRLRFEAAPDASDEALLNFPVSGQTVQISNGGVILFTGTSPTP